MTRWTVVGGVGFRKSYTDAEWAEIERQRKEMRARLIARDPPPPGSDEAVTKGCTCPVSDNARGQGLPGGQFWISEGCPLHAPAPDHSATEGTTP